MTDKQTQNKRDVAVRPTSSTVGGFSDVFVVGSVVLALQMIPRTDLAVLSAGHPLRVGLVVVTVFFLTGYSLTTLVFPTRPPSESARALSLSFGDLRERAPTLGERLALSFGLSVAVIPLAGMVLAAFSLGYDPGTVIDALTALVALPMLLGTVRRAQAPETTRYAVPLRPVRDRFDAAFVDAGRLQTTANVAIAAGVLAFAVVGAVAVTAPQSAEEYTEFSVLAENAQGELVTDDYPRSFTVGESRPLTLFVGNQEGEPTSYDVVVLLERVGPSGAVVERVELDRIERTVEDGPLTWEQPVTPTMAGEDLRLTFLLYEGDAPADPQGQSAYRSVAIWIDVTE